MQGGYHTPNFFPSTEPGVDHGALLSAALAASVALNVSLLTSAGPYPCTTQIVVPAGARWYMDPMTVLIKDFAGTVGDKPANSLIRNENAPTIANLAVDPGPWVPTTTDDNIHIEGGRIRHNEASDIGGGMWMVGCNNLTLRQITVEHSRQDWAFSIGGDDITLDRLRVEENDLVYEDGIHVVYGSTIDIIEPHVHSGDDAIAIGAHWNLPVDDVTVRGARVRANRGHAIRIIQNREGSTAAFAPPTQKISNVRISGVVGSAGILRNGLIRSSVDAITGTAQAGAATTVTLASTASGVDDFYNGARLTITGGTGVLSQFRDIIDYNGTTKVATLGVAWGTTPDATTTYSITGCLVEDLELVDVSVKGGDVGGHDGTNPIGLYLDNCKDVTLRNVSIRNSIRTAIYLARIQGNLIVDGCRQKDPQETSGSYYGMQFLDCPEVMINGGSFERRSTAQAIYVLNSKVVANGVQVPYTDGNSAAFRVNNTATDTSRLVLGGCRFGEKAGGATTRAVHCDGTGSSYYLDGCDVTGTAQTSFNGATPAETAVGNLVPSSRNV